jgi:hypothetical protein
MNKKTNNDASLRALMELINTAERSLHHARILMSSLVKKTETVEDPLEKPLSGLHAYKSGKAKVIEGVFNGRDMIGSDRKVYPVPANYASKSKIIEGSKLKATIKPDGSFQYKIIEEIESDTTTGTLIREGERFMVISQDGIYQVLPASVTFLQARVGDRVAIRIPRGIKATYATIDTLVPHDVGLVEA